MNRFMALAAAATLALGAIAHADFFNGQLVSINGAAGPELGGTTWGTAAGQGFHAIGGLSTYYDSVFGDTFTISVQSQILNPGHLQFIFVFDEFAPGAFSGHSIDILGLKDDNSIVGATATQGFAVTGDGNSVNWIGFGEDLELNPTLVINVFQVPAPGAIALVGLAGVASRRRRA